ncbi:MAG: sulfite exporter TauE/SafE family protein [Candidatus Marinimicrobia bacterium]|nr:sulfite exporter TauE/SafE family protein [Candidatus Neomarinimicrobiota bacterium]MBL7009916.1 sulfite exporter TauE/SafE family protein [Candidatus Neomarinimicrobiota bacterium]MBL7029785.1 sulfite exporter TauE/SafE family protein [Candidatus Neomarinimicrobiota bacterium]
MIETIILIIAAFLTSMLSAIIGMGGGVTLLGIMAVIIPEGYMVVALHGVIQLVSNVTRSVVYRTHLHRPIFNQFVMGVIPGLILAVIIILGLMKWVDVHSASEIKIDFLKPLIGIYILWFLLLRKKGKPVAENAFLWMGGLSGLVTVFIGASGPLIAPFFINKEITKENVISTKAACQAVGHLGKMPIFIFLFDVNYLSEWTILLPLVFAVYFGTKLGKRMLGKLPEATFKLIFKIVLALIAVRLILFGFIQ